jgi:hypothetical protein
VSRWYNTTILSSDIHLFSRLSGKVSPIVLSPVWTDVGDMHNRVLMACIRNLGNCPCPRCTIQLSDVHLVGTTKDRRNRKKLSRTDDHRYRLTVSNARKAILERNFAVNSAVVERLLQPRSLVPTAVRHSSPSIAQELDSSPRMRFLTSFPSLALTCFHSSCQISCTMSRSGFGGVFWFNYCEYCNQVMRNCWTNWTAGRCTRPSS